MYAKEGCPFEVRSVVKAVAPTVSRAAYFDDPCDSISDIYEYYDAYQSAYDADDVSVDVAIEITGSISAFESMVVDISAVTNPTEDYPLAVDYYNATYEVMDDGTSDGPGNKTWNGMACDDKAAWKEFINNKIGTAFAAWAVTSGVALRVCAEAMEIAGALTGPAAIGGFLTCAGVSSGIAAFVAASGVVISIGEHWYACSGSTAPLISASPSALADKVEQYGCAGTRPSHPDVPHAQRNVGEGLGHPYL